jgi:Lipid A 3-O-deacylase (PagL)
MRFLLIGLLLLLFEGSSAQFLERNYLAIEPTYGVMMNLENVKKYDDPITGFDLSYAHSSLLNTSEYIKRLNVKYHLTSFTYMNQRQLDGMLDSSKNAFGDAYMLTHSLMIGLVTKKKNAWFFIPGFGIVYDTKTFYDDFRNIFIGSHLNYAIRLESQYHFHLKTNSILIAGLKYMHYSNGAIILPNRGINSISVKLGYAFKL